jgi:hypothetical protein
MLNRHSTYIEGNKIDATKNLHDLKNDFSERIEAIDDFCSNAIAVVERSMGRVESLAKDNVNKKEDDLKLMFDAEIYAVRETMKENTKEIQDERKETNAKNQKTME